MAHTLSCVLSIGHAFKYRLSDFEDNETNGKTSAVNTAESHKFNVFVNLNCLLLLVGDNAH